MPRYEIFASHDGDTFRDTIEAEDENEATLIAYDLIAKEFQLEDELSAAKMEVSADELVFDADELWEFAAELDGFMIEEVVVPEHLRLYRQLHDGLSDMIEGERLTRGDIPDDYDWLIGLMVKLVEADPAHATDGVATIEQIRAEHPYPHEEEL